MTWPWACPRHPARRSGYLLIETMGYIVVLAIVLAVVHSLYYAVSEGALGLESHSEILLRWELLRTEFDRDVRLCDALSRTTDEAGDRGAILRRIAFRMPDGVIHVWEPGAEGHGLQRRTARNGAPTGSQPFFTWGDVRFHVQERNGSPQGVIVDLVYLGGRGKDRFGTATALSFSVYSEALKWDGDAAGSGRP